MGQFGCIGHIKPIQGGGFHIIARGTGGFEYDPGADQLRDIWRLPAALAEERTDFDTERMLAVSTDYLLVTNLIDLRMERRRLTIDNRANYRESVITTSYSGNPPGTGRLGSILVLVGSIAAVSVLGWLLVRFLRARRLKRHPGSACDQVTSTSS